MPWKVTLDINRLSLKQNNNKKTQLQQLLQNDRQVVKYYSDDKTMQTKFISLLPAQTIAKQAKQAKILIFLPQHNINLICSDFIWFKFTCFHYSKVLIKLSS